MDIINFISWLKSRRYSATVPANAVTVVGVPTNRRDDSFLSIAVPVSALGGGSNIGKLLGGGIVVSEWDENGVKKALIASLTDLGITIVWTVPAQQFTLIGPTAQNMANGSTNTDAIIAQAGVLNATYAAGLAKLYLGGGFNDWYLPAASELDMCYSSAGIVNKVLGVNSFANNFYWSSTEVDNLYAWIQNFFYGSQSSNSKSSSYSVRAVRIHTL